jgi:hypothetical protein
MEEILTSNLKELLNRLKPFIFEILKPFKLEKSRLIEQMDFFIQNGELVLYAPEYIEFVDKGRGAGKMPPVQKILDWVIFYQIGTGKDDSTKIAWAVAKSISKNGTRGKFFLQKLTQEVFDLYVNTIDNTIDDYFKQL